MVDDDLIRIVGPRRGAREGAGLLGQTEHAVRAVLTASGHQGNIGRSPAGAGCTAIPAKLEGTEDDDRNRKVVRPCEGLWIHYPR